MFFFSDISVCIFGSGNQFSCNCSRSGSVILLKRSRSGLGCFNLSLSGSSPFQRSLSGFGFFNPSLSGSVFFKLSLSGFGCFNPSLSGSVFVKLSVSGFGFFNSSLSGSVCFKLSLSGSGCFQLIPFGIIYIQTMPATQKLFFLAGA